MERAVPVLPGRDLGETRSFYERLGFEHRGPAVGAAEYLILGRGDIELHFWHAPHIDPLTTDAGCYVRVADADALHAAWASVGVPTDAVTGSRLTEPADTPWGQREFALVDPSGNLLRVGSPSS